MAGLVKQKRVAGSVRIVGFVKDIRPYLLGHDAAIRTMGVNGHDRIRWQFRVEETVRRAAAIVCG